MPIADNSNEIRIEAPEEEEMLLELGVQVGQGYLFGEPRPLERKTTVLSD